jgi:hypothetical protein
MRDNQPPSTVVVEKIEVPEMDFGKAPEPPRKKGKDELNPTDYGIESPVGILSQSSAPELESAKCWHYDGVSGCLIGDGIVYKEKADADFNLAANTTLLEPPIPTLGEALWFKAGGWVLENEVIVPVAVVEPASLYKEAIESAKDNERTEWSRIRALVAGTGDPVKLAEYADKATIGENIVNGWLSGAPTEAGTLAAVQAELDTLIQRGRMPESATVTDLAQFWVLKTQQLRMTRSSLSDLERTCLALYGDATNPLELADIIERAKVMRDNFIKAIA